METPEALAPQVVAVIVTSDPGEWFEEGLAAFAAQDYPELSVLVLDCGVEDVRERVATALPGAFVRRLPENLGFGASANTVLEMVQGASHFLFSHDDVAPDPDTVAILVEESFRSNAGVVGPKVVSWEDSRQLLHVGMAVDKGGAVIDRVELGEIDHGQHDSVRDVFLAPGGCTLVRADLFEEIGGFDAQIFAMGEDLDLCWRAQVAGARVIVAPEARVRHIQLLASGRRGLPEEVRHAVPRSPESSGKTSATATGTGSTGADSAQSPAERRRARLGRRPRARTELVTLQSLQRRHELRAVLKNYGPFHRVRVLPQLAILSAAEIVISSVTGHTDRAAAVIHAWRWNLTELSTLRAARAKVKATRRLDDRSVRRLQLHGSARLTAYLRRTVLYGMRAAGLGSVEDDEPSDRALVDNAPRGLGRDARDGGVLAPSGANLNLSRGLRVPDGELPETRATRSARVLIWGIVAVLLIFGTRQLLGGGFPYVGQLLPFPSWSAFIHRFLSAWQPSGVGTTSSASPGNGILGVGGLLLFGGVGLLQKVVVLGCIPLGAIGMSRLVSGFGSARARVASSVAYLAIPLPYDALATGHWDALLAYAFCPWIVSRLARAPSPSLLGEGAVSSSGARGYANSRAPEAEGRVHGRLRRPDAYAYLPTQPVNGQRPSAPWRTTLAGRALGLGLLEAVLTSLAPSGAALTLVMTVALGLGTFVIGGRGSKRAAARILALGVGATIVTVVLLAPWSVALLSGPQRWQVLSGLASAPGSAASWGMLLHLGIGPIGDTPLAWGFAVAGAFPLLLGRGPRLAWAGRAWILAIVAWLLAWSAGHGWLGAFSVPGEVLLVPAGVGIALAIGIGVAAFEKDLPGHRFGWRQAATGVATLAAACGTLPFFAATSSGRWDLPADGYGEATSWMARQSPGDFRVLWLGDPAVLPDGAWQISPGLAYGLSEDGLGDATSLLPGSSPGPAGSVGTIVHLAESAKTVRAGLLLAPFAVRYIVVVSSLAPTTIGSTTTVTRAPPAGLIPGLASQIDLRQVISQSGFQVFTDDASLPERALLPSPAGSSRERVALRRATGPTGLSESNPAWRAVLKGRPASTHVTGRVGAGVLFDSVAPPAAWRMSLPGKKIQRAQVAFGFGSSFEIKRPARVTVMFAGSWRHALAVGGETALWVVALLVLLGRRRWFERWFGPSRRVRRAGRDDLATVEADVGGESSESAGPPELPQELPSSEVLG